MAQTSKSKTKIWLFFGTASNQIYTPNQDGFTKSPDELKYEIIKIFQIKGSFDNLFYFTVPRNLIPMLERIDTYASHY